MPEIRNQKSEIRKRNRYQDSGFGLQTSDFSTIIIGGGIAGLTLTAVLASNGVRVLCLDREAADVRLGETFDGRTTAISFGSRAVMEAAGVWNAIEADSCPIRHIEIRDGDSPLSLDFRSEEVEDRSFGWIVENRLLRRALIARIAALKAARHRAPAQVVDFARDEDSVSVVLADGQRAVANLVIGADGRDSLTREWMGIGARAWRYDQRAIVCTAAHEYPHDNIAVEHFHSQGPFAILPMSDAADGTHRSSVVWTEHGKERDSALGFDQRSFDAALGARFPARYGRVRQVGDRFSYPLALSHAHDYIAPRFALIAEAAHAIHPIAGQGLNLGLRDVAALAELVIEADDPGADDVLALYQRRRRRDNMAMAAATDGLNRLFSNDNTKLRLARRIGLRAVAKLPIAKQFFMRQAMGLGG